MCVFWGLNDASVKQDITTQKMLEYGSNLVRTMNLGRPSRRAKPTRPSKALDHARSLPGIPHNHGLCVGCDSEMPSSTKEAETKLLAQGGLWPHARTNPAQRRSFQGDFMEVSSGMERSWDVHSPFDLGSSDLPGLSSLFHGSSRVHGIKAIQHRQA